jgi:hypothetical protein
MAAIRDVLEIAIGASRNLLHCAPIELTKTRFGVCQV